MIKDQRFLKANAVLEVARISRLEGKKNVQEIVNLLIIAGVSAKDFNTFISGLKETRGQDRVCIDGKCITGEIERDWSFLNAVLKVLEEKINGSQ